MAAGITGAMIGAIAAFTLSFTQDLYKTYCQRSLIIRRTQFALVRQRNELKMLVQNMDGVRHLNQRANKVPQMPLHGQLSQFRAEELDFLLEEEHLTAQQLVAIDLANSAYVNVRFVNDLRNALVRKLFDGARVHRVTDQNVSADFNPVDVSQVAKLTDDLYANVDDALGKCLSAMKMLSDAGLASKVLPGDKYFIDITPTLADLDWEFMQDVVIYSTKPDLRQLGDARAVFFEICPERSSAHKLARVEQELFRRGINVARLHLTIGKRMCSALITDMGLSAASELMRIVGLGAYYWIQEDVLNLIDPWHARPSARCTVDWRAN